MDFALDANQQAIVDNVGQLCAGFDLDSTEHGAGRPLGLVQMRERAEALGGEFAIMFTYMAVIYYALKDFGAAAQAGFGIGSRVLGLMQVPAMAMAFAAGPIAGQNFGAGNSERVKETFKKVALTGTAVMFAFTMIAQWRPELLLGGFARDSETMAVGALFLQMISLNPVAQGLIFVSSSMFQGLGDTKPVLLSSGARLITYATPMIWLSARPDFRIEHVWYLSIVSTTLQAALSLWLLRLEFRKRLVVVAHEPATAVSCIPR